VGRNIERRRQGRSEINWEMHLSASDISSNVSSINVSDGGMLFKSPVEMEKETTIKLTIDINEGGEIEKHHVVGKIVHCNIKDDYFNVAVEFIEIEDRFSDYLKTID
jgi:hypothetical protein